MKFSRFFDDRSGGKQTSPILKSAGLWYTESMNHRGLKKLFALACALLLLLAGCALPSGAPSSGTASLPLHQLAVYGEHALLWLEPNPPESSNGWLRRLTLDPLDRAAAEREIICGDAVNQGLCLYQLEPGSYRLLSAGQPISAGADFLPLEGYTLPRGGERLHWRFSEQQGLLILSITAAAALPEDYYDIFIDVGHGGADSGAVAAGYIEAEENLRAASYLAELLEERGFKVMLSREGMAIGGGAAAEDNPYLAGARVDAAYRSQASYLISNHLNSGGGSGFQIYTSVLADNTWAEAVAARFAELGWGGDNGNSGLVEAGTYKRWTRDNPHSGRDYYFILRETGGYALAPYRYKVLNDGMQPQLRRGAEGILLEYLFLDNSSDRGYWELHYQQLVEAAADGCCDYWQIPQSRDQ